MKKVAFTLVLNGMPFIRQQAEIIPKVFDKWYIIEGATKPVQDTSWCRNIDNKFYSEKKLSVDGTSEFLDSIQSDKVVVIRKNDFWNGKVEMCNSFMREVEDSVLMEFDVDEIWKEEVLKEVLEYAEQNDHFQGMLFKCNYYVGENLKIVSENAYGDYGNEWCRLWKVKNKTMWVSHEPPRLLNFKNFLSKSFTKEKGWIFDHYAYVLPEQVKFKENFYGYTNAYEQWKKLQVNEEFPTLLGRFLPWVRDNAMVDKVNT